MLNYKGFQCFTLKRSLRITVTLVSICFLTCGNSFAQQNLEDVVVLHPRTNDTLLVASQVEKVEQARGKVLLKRPKNTYQMSFAFPFHGWKADFSQAIWDTESDVVYFSNPDSLAGYCLAEEPVREGLEISSMNLRLAIVPRSLTLLGISGIRVANGFVVPSQERSLTLGGKETPTLTEATLLLNAFSRYHKITNSTITLESRFSYSIEGGTFHYQPIENKGANQEFTFKDYEHKSKVTTEYGRMGIVTEITVEVTPEDQFQLPNGRLFKGKLKFVDSSPTPTFSGKVQTPDGKWVRYKKK